VVLAKSSAPSAVASCLLSIRFAEELAVFLTVATEHFMLLTILVNFPAIFFAQKNQRWWLGIAPTKA
jgi:hypothetical protein